MKYKLFLSFIITTLVCFSALAESMPVPIKIQTALFLKILSYDKSIKSNIKIGILSGSNKQEILKSFQAIANEKIGSYSFSVVDINDIRDISNKNINVLYVPPDNKNKISQISKAAKNSGILTLTGIPDYVESGELSVAIETKDGKPKILVNMDSFKRENRDFSSQLLKLCRIL
ncbi:MAG: YfiR family protein [Candidatus Sericytochromatia bacterium]